MISLGWNKIGRETLYRKARHKLGLTRAKMAEKLDITLGAYHHIEMGNVYPGPKVFFKTLEVLEDVTVQDLKRYFFEREEYIEAASLRSNRRTRTGKA